MASRMQFLRCLYEPGDLVEVRLLPSGKSVFRKVERFDELIDELRGRNDAGEGVYIGANPRSQAGGKATDVACARCLFVDIDHESPEAATKRIADAGLPGPTCTVASGHGLHAYWRLVEPVADLRTWTASQKQLIKLLGSDKAIHDAPRIMQLPGYRNHKEPAADCAVIDADPQRCYALRELVAQSNSPPDVAADWLQQALSRTTTGNRNDTGLWLACQLRDAGLSFADAEACLRDYAGRLGDDYAEAEALATVRSAYSRPAREPAAAVSQTAVADPPVLSLAEQDLPEITADVLPDWARKHAVELSEAKEVPPAMAVLLTLPAMAACVQRAFRVQVEPSYVETLCIYAAPALESGERKSAIHRPVVAPLFEWQRMLQRDAGAEQQRVAIERELIETEIKGLKKSYPKANAAERDEIKTRIVELTGQLPPVCGKPQVIMEDFTAAALEVALSDNGESMLVTSDEGGLFDNLSGRHSDTSEIDLFLQAHTGSEHTTNRVGRKNVFLNSPLLSVGISPQPAVLAKLATKDGFIGRGLTARFLWALPRSRVGHRTLRPANMSVYTEASYHNGILAMAKIGREHEGGAIRLELHPEAYKAWKAFEHEIEPRIAPTGDLRWIKSWASKLPGAVSRIAGVCHVGKRAVDLENVADANDVAKALVSLATMQAAVELGRALIPHGQAVHRLMLGSKVHVAQAVVAHYDAEGWPRGEQSLTQWWRPVRPIVGETPRDFEPIAQILAGYGYLIETAEGKRPRYRANSNLFTEREAA